jgi:hypothetical protein
MWSMIIPAVYPLSRGFVYWTSLLGAVVAFVVVLGFTLRVPNVAGMLKYF